MVLYYKEFECLFPGFGLDEAQFRAISLHKQDGSGDGIPRWPWFVFLTGTMVCLVCSSLSHLLACHSERYNLFFWRLPCDSFFIPCSHLLYLLLQPQSTVPLSNLHIGAFDIAGHSHRIFHLFIVLAALSHSAATLVMMRSQALPESSVSIRLREHIITCISFAAGQVISIAF